MVNIIVWKLKQYRYDEYNNYYDQNGEPDYRLEDYVGKKVFQKYVPDDHIYDDEDEVEGDMDD